LEINDIIHLYYYMNLRCLNITFRYIYTFALTNNNSRVMHLQLQECVNSKGILFTIYRHRTQPGGITIMPLIKVYNIDSNPYELKGHSISKSVRSLIFGHVV
jgi:hypothetical protein